MIPEINQFHVIIGYGWLVAALFLVVLEAGTPGLFFFLSFAIGSVCASPCAFLQNSFLIQAIAWLVGSGLSLIVLRSYAQKNTNSSQKTNIDALIGQQATVTQTVEPHHVGYIKIRGEVWPAINKQGNILHQGTLVTVVAIQGNKLIVDRIHS